MSTEDRAKEIRVMKAAGASWNKIRKQLRVSNWQITKALGNTVTKKPKEKKRGKADAPTLRRAPYSTKMVSADPTPGSNEQLSLEEHARQTINWVFDGVALGTMSREHGVGQIIVAVQGMLKEMVRR